MRGTDLSLDFDHIIENQMGEHHEGIVSYTTVTVTQSSIPKSKQTNMQVKRVGLERASTERKGGNQASGRGL